jgi:spermidine synthase
MVVIFPILKTMRLLFAIFFLSGASSLVYQVVWQRMLTVYYGVGSISIALIVSVYMLGLGLGALWGGRLADRLPNPLLGYCAVEFMIAAFGAASLPFLDLLGRFTAGTAHSVAWLAMFAFLLVPTVAMGATLPLLVKTYNHFKNDFLNSVSLLYFVNTLGAALGALITAYGLITFGGLDVAVAIAVGVNLLLALLVLPLSRRYAVVKRQESAGNPLTVEDSNLGRLVFLLVFVSGFLAIGYEIVWFRMIGVLTKASPYAFSTSLSVYLLGIALGSLGVKILIQNRPDISRLRLFFGLQFATGLTVLALLAGFTGLAEWRPTASLANDAFTRTLHPSSWKLSELLSVFIWPVYFQALPTFLIGACFPLLASLALKKAGSEGNAVGRVYFINTIGNLLGGVICGFLLLEWLGSERTLMLFAAINVALLLLAPSNWLNPLIRSSIVLVSVLAVFLLFPSSNEIYRVLYPDRFQVYEQYFEEGVDGVVATFKRGPTVINYINGLEHGGRPWTPFLVQAAEAISVAPKIDNVLIIGFGTGTFTEVVLRSKQVKSVTLVELNHALLKNLKKMDLFEKILKDPRLKVIYDDGRRHLLRTESEYDLILMDPLRTTTAYSNNLYSLEFFKLVSQRLAGCGIFLAWSDNRMAVPRTVANAFPYVSFHEIDAHRTFAIASPCPISRDPENVRRLIDAAPARERSKLNQWFTQQHPQCDRSQLLRVTEGATLNHDLRPTSEYYLGNPSSNTSSQKTMCPGQ